VKKFWILAAVMVFSAGLAAIKPELAIAPARETGNVPELMSIDGVSFRPHAAKSPGGAAAEKLAMNSAAKDRLDALPAIGEAYSQKIIDGRPYRAKNALVRTKIIPQATYDKIKDKLIAKQK